MSPVMSQEAPHPGAGGAGPLPWPVFSGISNARAPSFFLFIFKLLSPTLSLLCKLAFHAPHPHLSPHTVSEASLRLAFP